MQSNVSVPIKLKKVTLRADKSYTPEKNGIIKEGVI